LRRVPRIKAVLRFLEEIFQADFPIEMSQQGMSSRRQRSSQFRGMLRNHRQRARARARSERTYQPCVGFLAS
jgi:hypothetical protein